MIKVLAGMFHIFLANMSRERPRDVSFLSSGIGIVLDCLNSSCLESVQDINIKTQALALACRDASFVCRF